MSDIEDSGKEVFSILFKLLSIVSKLVLLSEVCIVYPEKNKRKLSFS